MERAEGKREEAGRERTKVSFDSTERGRREGGERDELAFGEGKKEKEREKGEHRAD